MRRWWWLLGAALLVALAAPRAIRWLSAQPVAERLVTRWVPPAAPPVSASLTNDQERAALLALGRRVRGRLLWTSNRGGNLDVLEADLTTGRVRRLTNNPNVDFFARYSPDGKAIAFLRSRRTWVSFRERGGWDLFVMDANGGGVRRLAEHAYHPSWSRDGTELLFLRGNRLLAVRVDRGTERKVHDGAAKPTFGEIGDTESGPADQIAMTVRDGPDQVNGVGVLALAHHTFTRTSSGRGGCHVAWTPTGGLIWVESQGHGGTRVMFAARPGAREQVFMDLPGRHSHEYFPRITTDGKWLLWGAATEGHEHDRADYEIFAWQIGAPWTTALRLTYSTANDQWPDLRLE
jgi:dipeptidyl aminopeptidase/acylaminoacyl peptidase